MIRVLVVDDSPIVCRIFKTALERAGDIEVVGEAPDPYVAREQIAQLLPDVLILDMEMPRMDGLTFLRKVMEHHPMPVVVSSSHTSRGGQLAMEAFAVGAVEVLLKPTGSHLLLRHAEELVSAVHAAAQSNPRHPSLTPAEPALALSSAANAVIAIGASTGGIIAIEEVLRRLPPSSPPIFIAQHMPAQFTASFAARLSAQSPVTVREAADGEWVNAGEAVVAPGGKHLLIQRVGDRFQSQVREGPRVSGHCPSVDVLFRSAVRAAGARTVAVLLTGMGADGARGMGELYQAGAFTLAQDEASCVVYGMPKAAVELGAVCETQPLRRISARIVGHLEAGLGQLQPVEDLGR
jgi:two-component system chemotaxis response regulator CheB